MNETFLQAANPTQMSVSLGRVESAELDCGYCGLKTLSEEKIHLHYVDGNHSNRQKNNLLAIHESCHDYLHMSKSES